MKLVLIDILLVIFVKVIPVYSECDTYFGCIQDTLFGSFINLNATETQVSDIDVPGFENVNLESDSVDTILKHISDLFEEFVADYNLSSQFDVVRKNSNKTSIFVKTIETDKFNETFVKNIEDKKNTNVTHSNTTNKSKDAEENTELPTKEHFRVIKMNEKNKTKKLKVETLHKPVLDVNELSKKVTENEILDIDSIDYDLIDNSTDYPIIDYIDLYKDTTNEDVNMRTTVLTYPLDDTVGIQTTTLNSYINEEINNKVYTKDCSNTTDIKENIFPWVTAIFIKNETSNQFDYYCDGALLSDTIIITAASCIQKPNATADDILVILGKRSLRDITNDEMISKIKEVHVHDNFTGSNHDIAIIEMAEPATLSDRIQRARLSGDRGKSATTGWAISGTLTLIPFEDEHKDCNETLPEKTFCAVYGNDVSVCPSYGGLYATRGIDGWFLRGIRRADPTNKDFCVNRSLVYTDLKYYSDWINMYVK
ncbi:transmembrane protease [Danaus plexippus plexippus]|uniref:Transmembrane protease n=1 Tax=Danaus plexippus plexippus TaxID=278856 RepID=A0A212FAT6_DANPL|nr:transmembrane protease [Danaus plexippus plexippus]